MLFALISRLVFLVFGCLYPIYRSYKIISNPQGGVCDIEELYSLVKYFVVFTSYIVLECFADMFLFWFPFYYELKIALLMWMTSPISNGSVRIYDRFVEPFIRIREPEIEELLLHANSIGRGSCYRFSTRLVGLAMSTIMDAAIRSTSPAGRMPTDLNQEITQIHLDERRVIPLDRKNLDILINTRSSTWDESSSSEDDSGIVRPGTITETMKNLQNLHLKKSRSFRY